MLIFYSNFLSDTTLCRDKAHNRVFLLIEKNGTSSIRELVRRDPYRYTLHGLEFFEQSGVTDVTVFIRDPIGRFISGLATQKEMYQLSESYINQFLTDAKKLTFLDSHTTPQFWRLLTLGKKFPVKFNLQPLSTLSLIDQNVSRQNVSTWKPSIDISNEVMQRLNFVYTEDIVMYNNFLNKTVMLDEIIERIKLETNFVEDISRYKDCVNYLY